MPRTPTDTLGTAALGRRLAAAEIENRLGVAANEVFELNRRLLKARGPSGRPVTLVIKTRRSGSWQATCTDGDPAKAKSTTYWIFVDLTSGQNSPQFFIAPDEWVRSDIQTHHEAYLRKYGGHRAENDASTHHAIQADRVQQWKNRWDLLR